MFNYSEQIEAFREERVLLSTEFLDKLIAHRDANRERLTIRISDYLPGVTLGKSSFKPQGSVAGRLIIQTLFAEEEYDVDDGVVMWRDDLVDEDGNELSSAEVKKLVCKALQDDRFAKAPEVHHNCVRVFYQTTDEERHHVDFAIYRKFERDGKIVRELAGSDGWVESDPTQVNLWVNDLVTSRNKVVDGWGTQFRHFVQLLKRFSRSRKEWDLPNGMKLMMLVAECQPAYDERIDVAFRNLLQKLNSRLMWEKVIRNLAHPDQPALTRTSNDQNVVNLQSKIGEALAKLAELDSWLANDCGSARRAWDWVFQSGNFFADFDAEKKEEERVAKLEAKAALISIGARTSASGIISDHGVKNLAHRFYGGTK